MSNRKKWTRFNSLFEAWLSYGDCDTLDEFQEWLSYNADIIMNSDGILIREW